ncbi:MAG: ECF transporter S component, partial [Clostridiales bacterium]|nr:ECF transporter S component [Clostridiales bacterium]
MDTKINKTRTDTQKMALLGILASMVLVLQLMAVMLPIFPFTIATVLLPITIGAALCGIYAGAWLGLVFGLAVLLSGNAVAFMAVNPGGTILTVLVKGMLAGLTAAALYKLLEKTNKSLAVVAAAIICPIVNTGIFVIGCYLFFMPTIEIWASEFGFQSATAYLFTGMIG